MIKHTQEVLDRFLLYKSAEYTSSGAFAEVASFTWLGAAGGRAPAGVGSPLPPSAAQWVSGASDAKALDVEYLSGKTQGNGFFCHKGQCLKSFCDT